LGAVEVTPFEVAVAYGTLANNGIRVAPRPIAGIVNLDGETVQRKRLEFEQVVTPQQAYDITHMLEDVITRGTARRARTLGFTRPAAGKTGTTNDFGDAWFVGYTPDLVAVVWVGFDRRESLNIAGGQAALPMWTEFMKRALNGQPDIEFVRPPKNPPKLPRRFAPYTPYVPYGNQAAPNFPIQRGSIAGQPSTFPTVNPPSSPTRSFFSAPAPSHPSSWAERSAQ
jgi:membrane carboxypeptidase/penicillin-binding protein